MSAKFTAVDDHLKACQISHNGHWFYNGRPYHCVDKFTGYEQGLQIVFMTCEISNHAGPSSPVEVDFKFSFGLN